MLTNYTKYDNINTESEEHKMKTWKLTIKWNGKVDNIIFSDNLRILLSLAKHAVSQGYKCYLKYGTF